MSVLQRVRTLEKHSGMYDQKNYMLVILAGWAVAWDTPEEKAKGYLIQPCGHPPVGGSGEKPFYLATDDELKAFIARPDVALNIYVIGCNTDEERARLDAWDSWLTDGGTVGRRWQ